MSTASDSPSTREQLLNAAGELFAEKGFRATTVRDICQRAGANVAAVNYHFGDKEHLYEEVVLHAFRLTLTAFPPAGETAGEKRPPAERLQAFILAFLQRRLDETRTAWHRRLLAREMTDPSPILRQQVEETIHKNYQTLYDLLAEMGGPQCPPPLIHRSIASIIGQCLFYHHHQYLTTPLRDHVSFSPDGLTELARHVTDFSLAAFRSLAGTHPAE